MLPCAFARVALRLLLQIFYCDHHHIDLPKGHRFPIEKYRLLRESLMALNILPPEELFEAPLARRDDLVLAHSTEYVDAVLNGTLDARAARRIGLPPGPQLIRRSLASVGGSLAASRAALRDGVSGNLAGGTHHAGRDFGEGFCLFNDLAVTAERLLHEGALRRVAILDLDVHQGNGNADIFGDRDDVFVCSVHADKNFPFRKVASSLDIPLPDGAGDEEYLRAVQQALDATLAQNPEIVLYQAGVDPLKDDSLGRLDVSLDGLRRRDALVLEACAERQLPIALSLGGGYTRTIELTVQAHVQTYVELRRVYGRRAS